MSIGDLLDRLRVPCATADSKEAAAEIERLRALNAELLAALEPLTERDGDILRLSEKRRKARAAIAKAKG